MRTDREPTTSRRALPRARRATLLLLATVALSSCATPYPLYEGPVRPDQEIAILDGSGNASILQVDGEDMPHFEQVFALEPGAHVVLFRARRTHRDGKGTIEIATHAPQSLTQCFVTVEMKAGHRYAVRSKIETKKEWAGYPRGLHFDSTVHVALMDETTGEPVPDLQCVEKKPSDS
jgi:hypothetical protein